MSYMIWVWNFPPKSLICWRLGPRLVGPINDRWLNHEGSDLINGLIHWWLHNLTFFGRWWNLHWWGLVGGGRPLGVSPWLSFIQDTSLPSAFSVPCCQDVSLSTLLCHPHHEAHSIGTSGTVSQKKIFLLLNCFSQVFCYSDKNLTNIWGNLNYVQDGFW
jgi:hypothetical protein